MENRETVFFYRRQPFGDYKETYNENKARQLQFYFTLTKQKKKLLENIPIFAHFFRYTLRKAHNTQRAHTETFTH